MAEHPGHHVEDFRFIDLAGGGTRVQIVPALGGKIASLALAGREWLWTSDVLPWRRGVDGASYVETADTGGYDECFPTVGPCTLPAEARAYAGVALPDHGELWAQEPEPAIERAARVGATPLEAAVLVWRGRRMPYTFRRQVVVAPTGEVEMRYEATNDGDVALPFIWSSHPLLPLTTRTRLELPDGTRVRVWVQHGIDLGGPLAEHRWPLLDVGGRVADFSRPDAAAPAYACKLFLDLPADAGRVRLAVEEGDARLEVELDVGQVPHLGLWLNRRGWTPFPDGAPYLNLAFEPCIGAPDTLTDALGAWRAAQWLEPGATREWGLTWRGARVEGRG